MCGQPLQAASSPARNGLPANFGWLMVGGLGLLAACCVAGIFAVALGPRVVAALNASPMPSATLPSSTPPATAQPSATPVSATASPQETSTASPTPLAPTAQPRPTITNRPPTAPSIGASAPDFALADAVTGQAIALNVFGGQPVLINFWATWCPPCREEMPAIQSAYDQHRADGLVVLAVDDDESQSQVVSYGRDLGLTFNLLLDPGETVTRQYRIYAFPTSFFVDRDGIIRSIIVGSMSQSQLENGLNQIVR